MRCTSVRINGTGDNMAEALWLIPETDTALVDNLARSLQLSEIVARILVQRGIVTEEAARTFLWPSLDQLHDPFLLPDMEAGVQRTMRALESGEKILVHGDYDVDGVTSAALLIRTLQRLGADVVYRIPHRKRDGYDIKPYTAEEAKENGVGLIITSDCGVTACKTIARANELGVDVVITDHHEQGEDLPDAVAVINPVRKDSTYPFRELAGVGVALKFAQALVRSLGYDDIKFVDRYLDLAALGTVADVMPLLGENRVITRFGLEALARSQKVGIQAMLAKRGLSESRLTTHSISYVLAPRINAVGRLDDATIALELLLTSDRAEADELVDELERRNTERQAEQLRILQEVYQIMESQDVESTRALVLSGEGWNSGVVGIVASKVVEQYSRPAILLSVDKERGTAVGSARSIEAFNIIEALRECEELLDTAGGHAYAAGLSLKADNIPGFTDRLNQIATDSILPEDLIPRIEVDAELDPEEASWELLKDIGRLEPFGQGNKEPLFVSRGVELAQARVCGNTGLHLKLKFRGRSGEWIDGIGFNLGAVEPTLSLGQDVDLCYNIRSNSYNGRDTIQLTVKGIREDCA